MKYKVYSDKIKYEKSSVYLKLDKWDDWFTYNTTYTLKYIDQEGEIHEIGSIKIGQFGMEENQKRPDIMDNFEFLSDKYFSVGQSDDYYENLKNLGEEIRIEILTSLKDMAFNLEIFENCKDENVTTVSLLRGISERTVTQQFNRIAHGGARLTNYDFGYSFPSKIVYQDISINIENPATLTFCVKPESNPPTNIHVVIGRNGVGKTFLIKNIINAATGILDEEETGYFFKIRNERKISASDLFANIICVSFSAFDDLPTRSEINMNNCKLPYIFIGLDKTINRINDSGIQNSNSTRISALSAEFAESLYRCFSNKTKRDLWRKAMSVLNSDEYFYESGISAIKFKNDIRVFSDKAQNQFFPLSSGHKIILLTITRLVEFVEEKSLIILDEPETHLHPPLLSAFIRALSDILIEKNGVAIVATHSPVILQEVPSSCVWKMQRSRTTVSLDKLQQETFGTNLNSLIREVFGLEVEKSGFHQLLSDCLEKNENSYNDILESFGTAD